MTTSTARYRCECLSGALTAPRGSVSCFCGKPLYPLPSGSSLIPTRTDTPSPSSPPEYPRLEPERYYNAAAVSRALTEAGAPFSDVTVISWCKAGTVPGAWQPEYGASWRIPGRSLDALLRQHAPPSENFGKSLSDAA